MGRQGARSVVSSARQFDRAGPPEGPQSPPFLVTRAVAIEKAGFFCPRPPIRQRRKGVMSMNMQERRPETDDERAPGGDAPGALSPKQELALQAVLSHPTLREAAAAAGVGDATLWRYMKDPEFSRRLREARREAVGHAALRLQGGAGEAVAVLRDLMTKEGAPPAARITAARTVLDYSFRVVEMDELKARLDELEQFILRKQEEEALDRGREAAEGGGEYEDED